MTAEPQLVSVVAQNDLDKRTDAKLFISNLSLSGRLKRASKSLGVSWGIALLCIFIPVLHFFLVPMGLLIGLFLFYRQLNFHEVMLSGSISCPVCNHEFPSAREAFNWPKRENCPQCNTVLVIAKLAVGKARS